MRSQRTDLLIIVIGRILQVAYGVAAMRGVTAVLSPDEIGRRDLVLSVTSWFALLLISPVGNYLNRQAVEWHLEGRLLESVRRFSMFLGGVALLGAVVVSVLHFTTGIGTPMGLSWLLWLVGGSLLVGTLTNQLNGLLNIIGFRGWYVVLVNTMSWLGLGLSVALSFRRGKDAESWLAGGLLAQLLVLAGSMIVVRRVGRAPPGGVVESPRAAGFDLRSVFKFSWPLIITTGFYWAQTSGYRFILAERTDVRTIGLLTIGLAIATAPLAMFDTLFTEYYRPIFYRDIKFSTPNQKAQAWGRYASAYFPAILLVAAFVALSGPDLSRVLVSDAFQSVAWLALWGALIQSALMVYATYVALTFASLDTRALIRPNILGAAAALSLTFLLSRRMPLLGPAIALTVGMVVTMLDTALRLGRDFPHVLPWRRLKRAALLAVPLAAALWGLRYFWPTPNAVKAIVALGGGGAYVIGAQLLLARDWLLGSSATEYAPAPARTEMDV